MVDPGAGGGPVLVDLALWAAEYYGTIVGVDVMFADVVMESQIIQVKELTIQGIFDGLETQSPGVMHDQGAGHIVATGPLQTDVTLAPMPPADSYFSYDANGVPVLGSASIAYTWFPIVAFFNLQPGPPGTYDVAATHPMLTCVAPLESPATEPRHLSLVEIICG